MWIQETSLYIYGLSGLEKIANQQVLRSIQVTFSKRDRWKYSRHLDRSLGKGYAALPNEKSGRTLQLNLVRRL